MPHRTFKHIYRLINSQIFSLYLSYQCKMTVHNMGKKQSKKKVKEPEETLQKKLLITEFQVANVFVIKC